jgi:hypothetical protein
MLAEEGYKVAVEQSYAKRHKNPHFEHLLMEKTLQKATPNQNKDNKKAPGDKKPRTAVTYVRPDSDQQQRAHDPLNYH